MGRLGVFIVILLLGANGYTWYEKSAQRGEFEKRETELKVTQTKLEAKARTLEEQGDSQRAEIKLLERRLSDTGLSVGKLRRKPGLEQRFHRSYPQLAQTDWGVVEVRDPKAKRYVEYIVVPLWMSETFIIDHVNAGLYMQCLRGR